VKCLLSVLHTNAFMEAWIDVGWGRMGRDEERRRRHGREGRGGKGKEGRWVIVFVYVEVLRPYRWRAKPRVAGKTYADCYSALVRSY